MSTLGSGLCRLAICNSQDVRRIVEVRAYLDSAVVARLSRRIRFSCLKDGTVGRGAFRLEPTRPSFGAGFCGGEGMGVSGPVPPRTPPTAPPKTAVEDEAWPCAALGVLPGRAMVTTINITLANPTSKYRFK